LLRLQRQNKLHQIIDLLPGQVAEVVAISAVLALDDPFFDCKILAIVQIGCGAWVAKLLSTLVASATRGISLSAAVFNFSRPKNTSRSPNSLPYGTYDSKPPAVENFS
jgi:hypothetical protein